MAFATRAITHEARAVADLFAATSIGDTVTYPQLSGAAGKDVRHHRYLLARGLLLASRETGATFENLRGVGYRRLPSADVHRLGMHARQRVRRATRRAATAIGTTLEKVNDMSNEALLKALREMSVLDLLRYVATDRILRKLPAGADNKPLSVGESAMAVVLHLNGGRKRA